MGFKTKKLPLSILTDSIIRLKQESITLNNVIVTNNQLTSLEIIEKVKQKSKEAMAKKLGVSIPTKTLLNPAWAINCISSKLIRTDCPARGIILR